MPLVDKLNCGWQIKLGDPSLTCAIPERLRGELLIIKRYTNRHFTVAAGYRSSSLESDAKVQADDDNELVPGSATDGVSSGVGSCKSDGKPAVTNGAAKSRRRRETARLGAGLNHRTTAMTAARETNDVGVRRCVTTRVRDVISGHCF